MADIKINMKTLFVNDIYTKFVQINITPLQKNKSLLVYIMKNLATLFLTFHFAITLMNAQSWTQFNDFFSKTTVYDMYMKDSIICVANTNGLYSSSDYGKTWRHKIRTQGHSLSADSKFIYAGTLHGFYRSSDKGITWENVHDKSVRSIIHIDSLIFVSRSNGIYVSSDHGLKWELSKSNKDESHNSLDKVNDTLYVGIDAGINVSFNKGYTWEQKSTGLGDVMVLSVTKCNSLLFAGTLGFISGYNSGVYMSANSGENWSKVTPNMTVAVAALASHGTMIFAGTIGNGVYVSTDMGMNWNLFNEGLDSPYIGKLLISGDTLYAMTGLGIVKTIISKITVKKEVVSSKDEDEKCSVAGEKWIIPTVNLDHLSVICPKLLRNSLNGVRYNIYSLSGSVVYTTVQQNDSFTIPLQHFPNGLYTLTANSGTEFVTSTFSIIR